MKRLLRIAFINPTYRVLLFLTVVSMCLLTFASQLEMFAIGIITQKGPDFFELFAPEVNGSLVKQEFVTKDELEKRWEQLDSNNKGEVTKADTMQFIKEYKSSDTLQNAIQRLNKIFPISDNLNNLALFLVFVALFKAITMFVHRFSTKIVAIRVSRDLRQQYFEHIQSLPMDFYQEHHSGTLSSRVVGDSALIAEAINAALMNYLQTPFTVVTTLILCFITSWQLSLVIFLGFPLLLFPISFLARGVKRIAKQIQQNQEQFAAVLIDFLSGIQTVKVFAMEDFSLKKYRELNERMASLEKRSARYDLSTRPVVHTIAMFFLAFALLYGLYVLGMAVSEVLFYSGLLYLFYEPVKKFAEENTRIQRGIAAADRMFEVMDLKPKICDEVGASELNDFDGPIEFDQVWFRYTDQWVLKGVSFNINKGETVAIVGPTGAGKSSIVQLLPRLYDIEKGDIRINGKSIRQYTQKSLREKIAFVPQRPFLFLDTITTNISFGRKYSPEQVLKAAKKAHADEFISRLPKGYATEISETGKNFSGGQQQRLAIARALVKDSPILIMDEATSSLDTVSENQIKEAIQTLKGQVTQIIIAHRLSTIDHADKIIYLEKGEKVAEGTKEALLQTCPGFRHMWEMMHTSRNN
jgi:ABC-type multidrug transport system fused ATPase/permease subunit